MRNRLAVTVAALFLFSACTPRAEVGNQNTAPTPAPTPRETQSPAASPSPEASPTASGTPTTAATLVAYENRAKGYTLERPDRWYWEHRIKSQLPKGDVTDLFRTDPKPLPGIPSETYGRIAIEVSSKNVEDVPAYLKRSPTLESSVIAGITATRYEGTVFDGVRVIEYRFARQGETYRFIYSGANDPTGVKIFDRVVESFKLTE